MLAVEIGFNSEAFLKYKYVANDKSAEENWLSVEAQLFERSELFKCIACKNVLKDKRHKHKKHPT